MSAVFEGPATLRVRDADHDVRVRLTGHLDPIDGRYHWRGMVFGLERGAHIPQPIRISIDGRTASGHLTEVTPWGTYGLAGVGAPPYPLDGVVIDAAPSAAPSTAPTTAAGAPRTEVR